MARLPLIDLENADARTQKLLGAVQQKLGVVPNMTRAMASSPAVLDAYLSFSGALQQTQLAANVREQIALAVAEINGCDYCLSAHTAIGGKLGLSKEDVRAARHATSADPKIQAVLALVRQVVLSRGVVNDQALKSARDAGVTHGEIAEVVALTALNIFTNYFNHVADPEIDFPPVHAGDADAQQACSASVGTEACSTGT